MSSRGAREAATVEHNPKNDTSSVTGTDKQEGDLGNSV